jgi:hypothetical protein
MGKEFLDYDADTGLAYYTEQDGDKTFVRSEQDCSAILDHVAEKRNSGAGDNRIAGHMNHVAEIPNAVGLEMLKKGINVWNIRGKAEETKLLREIETNYPHLKVTQRRVWRPT